MMLVISGQGVATGGAVAAGNVQERWVAALLLRTRAGPPRVQGPLHPETHQSKVPPPTEGKTVSSPYWKGLPMGCVEVISLSELRARKQWDGLHQELHTRFDQWLDD